MHISKETPIAIVGVSENPEKYGHRIFRDLLLAGYTIEGVNPKGGTVHGKTLYDSLGKVFPQPELVVSVVPPQIGIAVLRECAKLGITTVWMQPGAESIDAVTVAQELDINLTTHECIMVHEQIW